MSENIVVPEKKKRGRKKLSTISETKPVIPEEKPPPKKRGRKPKGGKIVTNTVISDNITQQEPNIILHLKCSLNDINNNFQKTFTYNPVVEAVIQLNGQDRFQPREGAYFNLIQTYNYHTSTPANGVNVFSFALHPEQHQPSGTANLSRIDNTVLSMGLYREIPYADPSRTPPPLSIVGNTSQAFIYCTNYNVLRIMSGMGGLAYSN